MDDASPELPEQRSISDMASFKVMANPLRVRLLHALAHAEHSVKELAAQLGEGQTKLYRHVELMCQHGFIEVVATRTVGGIEEKRYRATARSFVLDTAALGPGDDAKLGQVLSFVLDTARADIKAGVRDGIIDLSRRAPQPGALLIRRSQLKLTPEQAERYYRLLGEMTADVPDAAAQHDPRARRYDIVVAFHPAERITDDE